MKKQARRFYSENLMLSLAGHLVLVAMIITSVVVFVKRAEMVTPDRVQIMEIDLSNVKITGDETKLHNTDVPRTNKPEPVKATPQPASKSEPIMPKKDEPKESFVEDTAKKQKSEALPVVKQEKQQETPAPKKTTVVRVNREVVSLDRTLTVSVIDALRVAMTRCWNIDTSRPDLADIRAVAHLKMRPNGTVADVWFESAARAETDSAFAYVLATIRAAIQTCEPLSMLPRAEYSKWESIQLTFYPVQGRVM